MTSPDALSVTLSHLVRQDVIQLASEHARQHHGSDIAPALSRLQGVLAQARGRTEPSDLPVDDALRQVQQILARTDVQAVVNPFLTQGPWTGSGPAGAIAERLLPPEAPTEVGSMHPAHTRIMGSVANRSAFSGPKFTTVTQGLTAFKGPKHTKIVGGHGRGPVFHPATPAAAPPPEPPPVQAPPPVVVQAQAPPSPGIPGVPLFGQQPTEIPLQPLRATRSDEQVAQDERAAHKAAQDEIQTDEVMRLIGLIQSFLVHSKDALDYSTITRLNPKPFRASPLSTLSVGRLALRPDLDLMVRVLTNYLDHGGSAHEAVKELLRRCEKPTGFLTGGRVKTLLDGLADDPMWRAEQDQAFLGLYWGAASQAASGLGARTALAHAVLVDTFFLGDLPFLRSRNEVPEPRTNTSDEATWLTGLLAARKDLLLEHDLSDLVRLHVDPFMQLVQDDQWNLGAPVTITVDDAETILR